MPFPRKRRARNTRLPRDCPHGRVLSAGGDVARSLACVQCRERWLVHLSDRNVHQGLTALEGLDGTWTVPDGYDLPAHVPDGNLKALIAHLLLGDRRGAARDGRELLDFLTDRKETKWNSAFRHLLTAEGEMFDGQRQRAIVEVRRALELGQFPQDKSILTPVAAAVYAWAGAEDESTAILERLSAEPVMTMPPVIIARDPLYTVPLAGNARYQALQAKLEAQMAATKLQ